MGLDDDIAILAAAPLFGFFDQGALRLLSFAGDRIDLAPSDVLFQRGDRADGGYVVLAGTIALQPKGGGPEIEAGPSSLIGRNALFTNGVRSADARAATEARVVRISLQLMGRMLREFPDAAAAIHDWLTDDLADLVRDLGGVKARLSEGQDR